MNWKGTIVGIVVAAIVTFILSGLWYGVIMKESMEAMMAGMGMDPSSTSAFGMYFVAELLRAAFVSVGVLQKPVDGKGAFMVGALLGLFVCAWFGIQFMMIPSYTQAMFWGDTLIGGALFCGVAGWIIGRVNAKLK